jgi:AraC-like DNA-binding protein
MLNFQKPAVGPIVPYVRESDRAIRQPWKVPERRLLDYLLIYVGNGTCYFTVDGQRQKFQDGEFCLIQPGSLCELEGVTETATPFAHFDIFYHPNRENGFPTRPGQTDLTAYLDLLQPRLDDVVGFEIPVKLKPRHPKQLRDILLSLIDAWQDRSSFASLRAQSDATALVAAILEDHAPDIRQPNRDAFSSFGWITSYFSLHLHEPLSVEAMAQRSSLSPSRFNAKFKKRFGVPPHRYLLDMRIQHAQELLTTTILSQEEIAEYCGFADIHHFSKTFKRKVGLTPGAWRERRSDR